MSTVQERQSFNQYILALHNSYWNTQKDVLQEFNEAYSSQFYSKTKDQTKQDPLSEWRIETPHAFNALEQYITQLFMVAPAVEVSADPTLMKDVTAVQTLVNRWLNNKRSILEDATRLALLNPQAYLKLWMDPDKLRDNNPNSVLEAIQAGALKPWEVILDHQAESWDGLRYIGHVCQTTLSAIKKKYKVRDFVPQTKNYFFKEDAADFGGMLSDTSLSFPEQYKYITVVEIYDLVEDTLTIWTPDHHNGYKELHYCPIPIRTSDDQPIIPIIPLIFSWRPDNPLIGISTMARGWSSFKALNDYRTHMSNVVHSQVRTYIADRKKMSAHVQNGLFSFDGRVILVDVPQGEILDANALIQPIAQASLTQDFRDYGNDIMEDIRASSLLGPFARGEVTKATASEISVVSQYSTSESDKYRRQKNNTLEQLAMVYIRLLASYLSTDEDQRLVIEHTNDETKIAEAQYISHQTLDGKLRYDANDGGGSPITQATRKQQLVELSPLLIQLGGDPELIRREIVKEYGFNPDLAKPKPMDEPKPLETLTPKPEAIPTEVPNAIV